MTYQLLTEAWIPIRRADGAIEHVSPAETVAVLNPAVDVAAPRPDFRGAVYEFLIGLTQMTVAPEDDREWLRLYRTPPTPAQFRERLRPYEPYFDLDHPHHPFMQEAALRRLEAAEEGPIGDLLIETPGDKTVKDNTDHFVKRRQGDAFCPSCAASALYTLQAHAPQGGRGTRTSLRGGAPLTTLVTTRLSPTGTLWKTLWLNVLPRPSWTEGSESDEPAARFPWVASFAEQDLPPSLATVHPDQHYWATPRRVLLNPPKDGAAACTVCARPTPTSYRSAHFRAFGRAYGGSWRHPLSPTYESKGTILVAPARSSPTSYRHWAGLVTTRSEGKRHPAPVVGLFRERRQGTLLPEERELRLWAFGFETSQATIEGWYEGTMPLHDADPAWRPFFEQHAQRLVLAAEAGADHLRVRITLAFWDDLKQARGDTGSFKHAFWTRTELPFYAALGRARERLQSGEAPDEGLVEWRDVLLKAALDVFDGATQGASIAEANAQRVSLARLGLRRDFYGKKVNGALGLQPARKEKRT